MKSIILNIHKDITLYNGETTTERIIRLLTKNKRIKDKLISKIELLKKILGGKDITRCNKCNGKLYLNPETNDVSIKPKAGYIKGCSCYIPRKVLNAKAKCPAGKW